MTMKRSANTTPSDMKEFEKDLRDLRMGVIEQRGQEEKRDGDKQKT